MTDVFFIAPICVWQVILAHLVMPESPSAASKFFSRMLPRSKRDVLDASGAVAFEGKVIILPRERLSLADNLPVFALDLLGGEGWTFEGVETPK